MKPYVVTRDASLRNQLSARLILQDRPEEADLILVFDDALDELENSVFQEKPVLFLHRGQVPDAPKRAFRLGVPEAYIIDAAGLRFSELRRRLEDVLKNPILPDPMVLPEADDGLLVRRTPEEEAPRPYVLPVPPPEAPEPWPEPYAWTAVDPLANYPGRIITVTGLRGGTGVSTVAAGLYHHLKTQGLTVALYSPRPQPVYTHYLPSHDTVYTGTLPDELPSVLILDLPHDAGYAARGETILVVEPTYYDLRLFEHGNRFEGGTLVINRAREDLQAEGVLRYFSVIQSVLRPVVVPFRPDAMDDLMKSGRSPDEGEPFAGAVAEIAEGLAVGV